MSPFYIFKPGPMGWVQIGFSMALPHFENCLEMYEKESFGKKKYPDINPLWITSDSASHLQII